LRSEAISLDAPAAPDPVGLAAQEYREARMAQRHINPQQWQQSIGQARQVCARIFRDGGSPTDALQAFGLATAEDDIGWDSAVDRIAHALCAPQMRKAA
jgi:hypothetical protein